ncbi:MAG: PAS domain S-box protein [Desulfobacula sp.]|nr:PAS domain S-box protein [Desulfobacula sp.]
MEDFKKTNEQLKREMRLLRGRIKELESTGGDLSNKKKKELAQSEQYYRSIINHIHDGIMVIGEDYRITDVNKVFLVTSGHKRDEVIGHYCYEISHTYDKPCDQHGEECPFLMVFKTGQPQSVWHEHAHAKGYKSWVGIRLSPLKDEKGKITHVVKAIRDVSDLVQAGKSLEESEKKYRRIVIASTD